MDARTPQEREFQKIWDTLELADTVQVKLGETIVPPRKTLDLLPAPLPELTRAPVQLEMGAVIGRGGMSRVHSGMQVALQREVAVKVLRDAGDGAASRTGHELEKAAQEILTEAWVTGLLEHPNIVPIHLLGQDERGLPMLVMKRIGGTSWHDVLHRPERHRALFGGRDPLDWHLDILIHVANAVHFAHSRGIVHRDLKPENVMVGEFGEVYVLDWGLAVALDAADGRFRSARQVDAIAGTPGYMAPEMVDYANRPITERTDVYLLGAILHEIVTGRPRHEGASLAQVLLAVYVSEPPVLDETVPPELAAIIAKATHGSAGQRFESAEAFKVALQRFLQHRESTALSREARQRLSLLRALAAETARSGDGSVQQAYAEARFGFQQALRRWEDNSDARAGLRQAMELMADHELRRSDYASAAVIVAELDPPSLELSGRLEALRLRLDAQHAELAELKRLRRDVNVDIGARARSRLAISIAVLWSVLPVVASLLIRAGLVRIDYPALIYQTALFGMMTLAGLWLGRRSLLATGVNRRIMSAILLLVVVLLVHRVTAYQLGLPVLTAIALELVVFFISVGFCAVTLDPRIGWAAPVYFVASLAAGFWPQWVFEITAAANFFAMTQIAWVTRPRAG